METAVNEVTLLRQVTGGELGPLLSVSQLSSGFCTKPLTKAQALQQATDPWSAQYQGVPPETYGEFSDIAFEKKYVKKWFELRDRLLSFGGHTISRQGVEEDLGKLLSRGQAWPGSRANSQPQWPGIAPCRLMKGSPNQCHANSSELWHANRENDVFLATGYALHSTGLWHQHSWCIQVLTPTHVRIVETTVKAIAYYGFVMTEAEAEDFYFDNL